VSPLGNSDGVDGLLSEPSGKKETIGSSKDPAGDERPWAPAWTWTETFVVGPGCGETRASSQRSTGDVVDLEDEGLEACASLPL
jgi:hypothetical protein